MISDKAIVARAKADTTINNLIAGRIWPNPAPQDISTYPRIVYWSEKADTGHTYSGPDGLASEMVTLSCEALTPTDSRVLADIVRQSFDGLRGTFGGTVVQGAFYDDERDEEYSEAASGQERLIFAREIDLLIWFQT